MGGTTTQIPRLLSEITSNGEAAFPWKLHRVLEESERCGFTDIVSWQGKRHFKVHDPKNFEQSIMKKFFNQTRYKSFQRQLNIYGFERLTLGTGADIGSYTHHLLIRGKPNICRFMVRTKVKNKGSKSGAASVASIKTTQRLSRSNSQNFTSSSRRASSSSSSATPTAMPMPMPKMIRSISCPGAASASSSSIQTSKHASIVSNTNTSGLRNDVFLPLDKVQPSPIRSMPSTTIDDDFLDEVFSKNEIFPNVDVSYDNSGTTKQHTSNVTLDGNYNINNNNNIAQQHRIVFPSMLLCDDNSHEGTTILDNSNRSTISQISADIALQPSPLDPFLEAQQKQRKEQMQQQQQQQQQRRQQQEYQVLQLQIQQLQNRIVHINQNRQQHSQQRTRQQNNNSSSYLCNGVAAIEPSDRSIRAHILTRTINRTAITSPARTISPRETNLYRSNSNSNSNSNNSHLNHPLHQLERDSNELHMLMFSPFDNDRRQHNSSSSNNNSSSSMCGKSTIPIRDDRSPLIRY